MLVHDHVSGISVSVNFTPIYGNSLASLLGGNEAKLSSLASPDHLYGIWEFHRWYGRLAWQDIVQPSIDLASGGFSSHYWNEYFGLGRTNVEREAGNGTVVLKQMELADVLRRVSVNEFRVLTHSLRISVALDRVFKYMEGEDESLKPLPVRDFLLYYSQILVNICGTEENATSSTMSSSPDLEKQAVNYLCLKRDYIEHKVSHISVIDSQEMLVSFTSGHLVEPKDFTKSKSGYIVKDQLFYSKDGLNNGVANDFYVHAIVYHPGKPCDIRMAIGSDHGLRSTSAMVMAILQVLLNNATLTEALAFPKLYFKEGTIYVEDFDDAEYFVSMLQKKLKI
ncbi:unnamed protein product, partial [Soboliphyme baturini]|uniref:Gamma-glutamyltranspeptidase 1 n=1 Tax=Soboliphyme baturini TaxID=241478 RepID=A0A183J2X7_9BILA